MIGSKLWYFMAFTVVFKYCTAGNVSDMLAEEAEIESVYAGYIPRGRVINIGNLPVYEAPDNIDKRRMLIAVYDLFGFSNNNMKQIADHMALQAGGFRVALPDFFRGDHWDINVPITPIERAAFVDRVGNWETIIKPDLVNVVRYYQSLGVQEFAIFGMCQGGRTSTSAAIELSEYFKASAIVHPSLVSNDEASLVRIPMYLMPSSAQPDMLPFYQVLRNRFGDNSGHRRFDDMFHGFASTRGNFSEPLNQMHVNEIIRTLGVFFGRILS